MDGESNRVSDASPGYCGHATSGGRFGATGDRATGDRATADAPPTEALKAAGQFLSELKTYVGHYLAIKADGLKLSLKRLVLFIGLGLVGLVVGGGLLITAAVLLLMGIANGIGKLFEPDQPWVGQLVVGLLVLGGALLATWMALKKITNSSRAATVAKYERKHSEQRAQLGHDVVERASEYERERVGTR